MNLSSLDLNLLKVLHALLETQSVSRASEKLNVTQPAVSHALKRLREIFDDPLLVRDGARMVSSAKALALRAPVAQIMSECSALLSLSQSFDPLTDRRTFRLAMSDAMTIEGLPIVARAMRSEAPLVDLVVDRGGPLYSCQLLIEDAMDVALGVFPDIPGELQFCELYRDELVCIADKSNPHIRKGRMSWEGFLACPHVTMAQSSDSGIQLDAIFASMGIKRRIAVTVPHYLAIPALIAGSDLVAHSRRKLLETLNLPDSLVVVPVPVPFDVPELVFSMVWHPRNGLDSGQTWLRDLIARALSD